MNSDSARLETASVEILVWEMFYVLFFFEKGIFKPIAIFPPLQHIFILL